MKKIIKSLLSAILVGAMAGPSWMYGAASGNYTDLLPIGAAANTTVISNGTGWSLTTLPPTQTFGDSLSRINVTVYQSTSPASVSNSTAVSTLTALSGQGKVGSTTFPASWIQTGRTMRISLRGKYGTTGAPSMVWSLKLATTTVLVSSAIAPINQADSYFSATALITIATTGASGSVNASYDILLSSVTGATTALVPLSTTTASAVSVDLSQTGTVQAIINPTISFDSASTSNYLTVTNAFIELLN